MVAQQELRKDAGKASHSTFLKNTVVFLHHFFKFLISWLSLINLHLGRLRIGWNMSNQKGTAGMSVSEVQSIIDYCTKTQHHSLFWVILDHISLKNISMVFPFVLYGCWTWPDGGWTWPLGCTETSLITQAPGLKWFTAVSYVIS